MIYVAVSLRVGLKMVEFSLVREDALSRLGAFLPGGLSRGHLLHPDVDKGGRARAQKGRFRQHLGVRTVLGNLELERNSQ